MNSQLGGLYRTFRKVLRNPGLVFPRKRPLATTPDVAGERFAFLGGVHRSGTSLMHRLLREHTETSGFTDTRVPEDEGQYLQSVMEKESAWGGPGQFALAPDAHMTESSPLVTEANRQKLLREWGPYFDLNKRILLEKTPANITRSRFLQALFPGCKIVFMVRHPIVVGLSTYQWTSRSGIGLGEVMEHWVKAHQIYFEDEPKIERAMTIRYEDLVSDPQGTVSKVCGHLDLPDFVLKEKVLNQNRRHYGHWENVVSDREQIVQNLEKVGGPGFFEQFGYQFTDPYIVEPTSPRIEKR